MSSSAAPPLPGSARRRVLLTTHHLEVRAGSELVTTELAEALRGRGDEVLVLTRHRGPLAEQLSARTGIPVLTPGDPEQLRAWRPDLLHVHHWPLLAYARSAGIRAPAVIGFLGTLPDLENPPPLGTARPIVWWGISEAVLAQVTSVAGWADAPHRLVRNWFDDSQPRRDVPARGRVRSVLVVSNHFPEAAWQALAGACDRIGARLRHVGLPESPIVVDADLLLAHDVVVTLGRTAIQAMSLGLPTLVLDVHGADGWVLPETVVGLARCNFSGLARSIQPTEDQLVRWLRTPPDRAALLAVQDWAWRECRFSSALDALGDLHRQALAVGDAAPTEPWMRVVGSLVGESGQCAARSAAMVAAAEELSRQLDDARQLQARDQADLREREERAATLERQLDRATTELAQVSRSLSWRVTEPGRWVTRRVRALRGSRRRSQPPRPPAL